MKRRRKMTEVQKCENTLYIVLYSLFYKYDVHMSYFDWNELICFCVISNCNKNFKGKKKIIKPPKQWCLALNSGSTSHVLHMWHFSHSIPRPTYTILNSLMAATAFSLILNLLRKHSRHKTAVIRGHNHHRCLGGIHRAMMTHCHAEVTYG